MTHMRQSQKWTNKDFFIEEEQSLEECSHAHQKALPFAKEIKSSQGLLRKVGCGPVLWWYSWIFGLVTYPMVLMILYYSHFDCKQPELNSLSQFWVELFLWLVGHWYPVWVEQMFVPISPGKVPQQMGSASSSILSFTISRESFPRNICYSMLL